MNHYEAKQEARRERLENRADRLRSAASAAFKRADMSEAATGIPFGQPILVGHHSEGKHRATIARADAAMRKSIELDKLARETEARAASVGSGGISSDDPDALDKLREKLAKLEADQAMMKAGNAAIRKAKGDEVKALESLLALGISEKAGAMLIKPDCCGRIGFADYQLTNNNANIRRIKARISELERMAERETVETEAVGGLRVVENAETNRLQLFFPDKPSVEMRSELKGRGFRWAPSEGAWQQHLHNRARWHAEAVVKMWEAQITTG